MKSTRNALLAKLHILLKEQNAEEYKSQIYAQFGVTSSREMSDGQLIELISRLEATRSGSIDTSTQAKSPITQNGEIGLIRRLRSEILCLLTRSPHIELRRRGLGVPNDWAVLNPFICRHTGVLLNRLDLDQLKAFRKQLLVMRDKGWVWHSPEDLPLERIHEANTVKPTCDDTCKSSEAAEHLALRDIMTTAYGAPYKEKLPS